MKKPIEALLDRMLEARTDMFIELFPRDSKMKKLEKKIKCLQEHFLEILEGENRKAFIDFDEAVTLRLVQYLELAYKYGFEDGNSIEKYIKIK